MRENQRTRTRSRRWLLVVLGSTGIAGLAGCSVPGSDDGSNGDASSPPGTEFTIEFDRDASNYTITYEGDQAFDEDDTDLLAIDHVSGTGTTDRMIWFGGPEFDPIVPGQSSLWGYDPERVTSLEVVWAPDGTAGSGRQPDVIARRSTP